MCRHERHIRRAIAATELSQCRFAVAAVLVKSGRVLTVAVNRWRNQTRIDPKYYTYHAEEQALSGVSDSAAYGSTLYIARTLRNGATAMARPCERNCWPILQHRKIRQVVYTTSNGRFAIEQIESTL